SRGNINKLYCEVFMKETCRICKEIKERIMHKIYKDGSTVFVDDNGKRWWGLACPGCIKVLRKKYDPYIPLDPNLECKLCGVHYTRKGSNSKYCSIECSKKAI